jgi:hypothetical protein
MGEGLSYTRATGHGGSVTAMTFSLKRPIVAPVRPLIFWPLDCVSGVSGQ